MNHHHHHPSLPFLSPLPLQSPQESPSPQLVAQSVDIHGHDNFTQGCCFSPDGLCVLTSTAADHTLRLYNTTTTPSSSLPKEQQQQQQQQQQYTPKVWKTVLKAQGADSVRCYGWYPYMNSSDPSTCAFLVCCRNQPIHLIDAYTAQIRAHYRPYNRLDEMESPVVAVFSPDGRRILAGGFTSSGERSLHVFDVAIPGRDSEIWRLGKTRRSSDGQKGLVSALAFSNCLSPGNNVFAVGTYSPGSIYLYDDRMPTSGGGTAGTICNGLCVVGHGKAFGRKKRRFVETLLFTSSSNNNSTQHNNNNNNNKSDDITSSTSPKTTTNNHTTTTQHNDNMFTAAKVQWYQSRARTGITQLLFSPPNSSNNSHILYSASRRSNAVLTWDVRVLSGNSDRNTYGQYPICGMGAFATTTTTDSANTNTTNQRLEFDLNDMGSRMYVGSRENRVLIYDTTTTTTTPPLIGSIDGLEDVANGISFHPGFTNNNNNTTTGGGGGGMLAVATGGRRFPYYDDDDDNNDNDDNDSGYCSPSKKDTSPPPPLPGALRLYKL